MTFFEIEHGSDFYLEECLLRQKVLRAPLGLNLADENLDEEKQCLHFGLSADGTLIACVMAVPLSPSHVKIRQMAVSPDYQGRGCGLFLMQSVERWLSAKKYIRAILHARTSAAGFYEKLGYHTTGSEFLEVGLSHVKMEKTF